MIPADLRNATWADIQPLLTGQRLAVYHAWMAHGPGTTRAVSQRAGIDILTFRPRTTELYQIGLLTLCGSESAHEGIYGAVPMEDAQAACETARAAAAHQMPLKLGA